MTRIGTIECVSGLMELRLNEKNDDDWEKNQRLLLKLNLFLGCLVISCVCAVFPAKIPKVHAENQSENKLQLILIPNAPKALDTVLNYI